MKTRLIGAILAVVLALAGTVVLTGYVRSADTRAAQGAELVKVYVVAKEIPVGTAAAEIKSFIAVREIPALAAVKGRVTKLSTLKGQVADVTLRPGEQVLASRWVDPSAVSVRGDVAIPKGLQAVTMALPVEQIVGGTVKPGSTVGVVITAEVDGKRVAQQTFHKVLVTAVQNGTSTPPAEGDDAVAPPADVVLVTLARTTPDIEVLVWGQRFGTVWLTIEPADATEEGSRVVDFDAIFGP